MTAAEIELRLAPFVQGETVPPDLYSQLEIYLALILRWNARTNLTAIRDAAGIVDRHFGESVFTALQLRKELAVDATLLDFGSGAGFPGLPIQLVLPSLRVTLAESQSKKAAFLREVVRTLALKIEVWAERVETMPPDRKFDGVTLRAVDRMDAAIRAARQRTAEAGFLAILTTENLEGRRIPMSESQDRALILV